MNKSGIGNLTISLVCVFMHFPWLTKVEPKWIFAILVVYCFNYWSSLSALSANNLHKAGFLECPNRYPYWVLQSVPTVFYWPCRNISDLQFFFLNRNSPYTFVLIFSNLFLFGLSFVVVILFLTASNFTLSWRRSLFYRNPSIDLRSKSMDWLLYDRHFPSKVLTLTSKTD